MIPLLRADWRKLRHRWMPRILLLILIAIVALVFFGISSRARFRGDLIPPNGLIVALSLAASFAAFLWPVLAGSWAGGEYGWGTIRMALTRQPSRIEFSLSGLVMVLLTIGGGLILVLVTGAVAGSIVAAATHASAAANPGGSNVTAGVIKLFFAAWYTSAFYAVLAYTAGVVFRSAPAGIGLGIGFAVAQGAVAAIFSALGDPWKAVAEHFPDAYTTALTSRLANEVITSGPFARVSSTAPGIPASILGLAIYLAVLLAAMLVVVSRRDVTA
jgi:ABC-type transport system involved in multi-copper enzyme maturation permease subunit